MAIKVFRRYMDNRLRNFNYLIVCDQTHEAIALDPLDGKAMVKLAEEQGATIRYVVNTHEHHDHIEGNPDVVAATGAQVLAHKNAMGTIPNVDRGLEGGDQIQLGELSFQLLHTPGHTPVHLCLLLDGAQNSGVPVLFSGDTLFNACAGNCYNGGNVEQMYESFVTQLMPLPDRTLLYPGHDYMKNNLGFALDREPHNQDAEYWQQQVKEFAPDEMPVMTLGQERTYNPFLRLAESGIREKLQQEFPDMEINDKSVFCALRRLRDAW